MAEKREYPDRPVTAGVGAFDTAGWTGPPMAQSNRRDYGPKGCAGIVVAPLMAALLALTLRGRR
jgi:hypothetical protein